MKIGAFIIARLSSNRLPAKNAMPILGKPMVQHLWERVRKAKELDFVAIATSTDPSDTPLCRLADQADIPYHRGSLENVMERLRTAAEAFQCDVVVEILGDNPLVHSDLIDDVIRILQGGGLDYAASITNEYSNVDPSLMRFALGVRVQAYRAPLAARWSDFPEFLNQLGTTAYIYDNPQEFKCGYLEAAGPWVTLNRPEFNFAVNYRKNFQLIEHLFSVLGDEFTLPDVMRYVEAHPETVELMGAE